MKKILIFGCFLFSTYLAYAGPNPVAQFDTRLTAVEKQLKKRTLYNAPAHAQVVDGYNIFLTGDLLYWKAEENGLTYVFKTKNPSVSSINGTLHLKEPHFEWDLGFRAGFGFILPHDHWDLYFNWTRFYTDADSHSGTGSTAGLFPVWALPNGPLGNRFVSRAKAKWKLFLNIVDVELGKEYYVGKKLVLRPHLDLRTAFVDQQYKIRYQIPSIALYDRIKLKNDYWGVGPRVGLNSQWWLGNGFSFSGDVAIALIFGNNEIMQKETVTQTVRFKQELHTARAVTDIGLYFGWDHMIWHDQFHIGLKAGWEQHIFFDQNQFFRFLSSDFEGSIVSNQGNLMLQGWTFSARIDF